MTHAIVLIEGERDAMAQLGSRLAEVEGVGQVYSVTGAWDFDVLVHLARHEQLAEVVTAGIGQVDGVARTQTMVAFEAFSRHDLEALFSVGQ
jgi:DNA-binding Lrp family transcriptional regulator